MTRQHVFACLGSDLDRRGLAHLQRAHDAGATVLALDSSAAGAVHTAGLPFTLSDDWLDTAARRRMLEITAACSNGWYQPAREQFTVDGVCWPAIDAVMMSGFWQEYCLQLCLAEVMTAGGVEQLTFFRPAGRRPSFFRSPADTFGAFWEAALGDALELTVLRPSARASAERSQATRAMAKARRSLEALRHGSLRPASREVVEGALVLAVGEDEGARFAPVVRELTESGQHVAAVVLEPDAATAANRGRRWGIPVVPGPALTDSGSADQFAGALAAARAAAAGHPWQTALEACNFHFSHYAGVRWPQQVSSLRGWEALWQEHRPAVVLVSSLDDARSQLPAVAAQRSGVRSVTLPHAAFYVKIRPHVASDWLLYHFPLQQKAFLASGAPSRQLRPVRPPAPPPLTDEAVAPCGATRHGRHRVLALINPVSEEHPGRAISDSAVGHRDQLRALGALLDPPPDLAERVDVLIKTHPLYPDGELLRAAGLGVATASVLPPLSDLQSALEPCSLVIGINYVGSALRDAALSGKPLIHFWTSPLLSEDGPNPYARLLLPSGHVAHDKRALWQEVRRLLADEEALSAAREQATAFARTELVAVPRPTLRALLVEDGRVEAQHP
jgi:hypothetical protein